MKIQALFLSILLVGSWQSALAVCADTDPANTYLGRAKLNTLLAGRHVCARSSASGNAKSPPGWNERHDSTSNFAGNVVEIHEVGTTGDDEQAAQYALTQVSPGNQGRITYNYPNTASPRFSFTYRVQAQGLPNCNPMAACSGEGIYHFCGTSSGAPNLTVRVVNAATALSGCPALGATGTN